MTEAKPVPDIVIGRLPIYLRALNHLLEEGQADHRLQGAGPTAGDQLGADPQGPVPFWRVWQAGDGLRHRPSARPAASASCRWIAMWDMALVGAGDLGHAIAHYGGFEGRGFRDCLCVRQQSAKDRPPPGRVRDL